VSETLTPVQLSNGRWYKREDLYRHDATGINGGKLRACQYLLERAAAAGYTSVISAASVINEQHARVAVIAARLQLGCTVIIGGTTAEKALRHPSVRIAHKYGARIHTVAVGYNPMLQKAAAGLAKEDPRAYWLRYATSSPPGADRDELETFHRLTADQVRNLPDQIKTLVIPFGSGNSAAGVLFGLSSYRPANLERVVLVGIGPDRRTWLNDRLSLLGAQVPVPMEHYDLHGTGYASYGDRMPGTVDGVTMHPTYEGKVVRYLDERQPAWWVRRDSTTCLWIVGGPLPTPARRRRMR
jgi:hypothetical protein